MRKLCESLREHAKNMTDFEWEKNLPFTKVEVKSYEVCYICGKIILKNLFKSIRKLEKKTLSGNYQEVRDHCHYTGKYRDAVHSICNL